jgi:hypothetical protein
VTLAQFVVEIAIIAALWLLMRRSGWYAGAPGWQRIGAFAVMVFAVVLLVNLVWPAG